MPDLILAPNYHQSTDEETTCGRCRFGGVGACRLYQFPYLSTFTCDSWQTGVQDNPHNGVMIALMVPPEVGAQLIADVPNPLPLEELHLTLGYLGKVDEQRLGPEYLRLLLLDFAMCWGELDGVINGVGRFNQGDGDTEAFYASYDCSDLPQFRHALTEFLSYNGVQIHTEHGFTPHITLAYIPTNAPNPIDNLPPIKLEFEGVTLGWGDRLYTVPLQGEWYPPIAAAYYPPTFDHDDDYYLGLARSWQPGTVVRAIGPRGRATDFPSKGEDKTISLSNSQYPQFDRDFAERTKEQYPDIWSAGGNTRGNEAYDLWERARGGDDAAAVLDWIKEREAWSARHYRDGMQFSEGEEPNRSNVAGVVALMKWGTIGELGEARMKSVINELAEKMEEESRAINANGQPPTEPGLLIRWGKAILNAIGLSHLFRTIKDVDAWTGAASQYEDTPAYCDACLINLNSGDRAEWVQGLCKLPVREPGDGADVYVRQAVYAAAQRFNQLTKPADVEQTAWDNGVKAAAKELVRAYEQMDEEPPAVLTDAARNRSITRERDTLAILQDALYEMSINLGRICLLHAIQYDDETDMTYLIMICEGMLYRAPYFIDENDTVITGEWEMLEPIIPAIASRSTGISVSRAANGRYHYTLISATPFLNRVGEIDSTQLFDSFITHARTTGSYPRLDFYHYMDDLILGQSYYLDRVGLAYVEMGWFDDNEVARSFAQSIMDDPAYWGNSIQYFPTADPMFEEVTAGIYALVYRGGIHKFTSLLPERMAANLFTTAAAQGENSMISEQELEALLKGLSSVNDETRTAILSQVKGVNRAGQSGNYVFRANNPVEAQDVAPVVSVQLPDTQPLVDSIVAAVVDRVNALIAQNNTAIAEQVTTSLNDLAERLEAVETGQEELQRQVTPVVEDHKTRNADKSAGRDGGPLFIPRLQRKKAEGEGEGNAVPLSTTAEATVNKIFSRH